MSTSVSDSGSSARPRLNALQVLRAYGTIMVFFSHTLNYKYGIFGGAGVSLFFVLSGFVMCYAYIDRELRATLPSAIRFSAGKVKKLYFLNLAVMIWILFRTKAAAPRAIILNVLMLKTLSPMQADYYSMNSVAWYLFDVAIIYAFFPFILRRLKRISKIPDALWHMFAVYAIMFLTAFLSGLLEVPKTVSNNFVMWFTYICPLYRLGDFIIGCDLGFVFLARQRREDPAASGRKRSVIFSIAEIGVILAIGLCLYIRQNNLLPMPEFFTRTLLWLPLSCALIYLFACSPGGGIVSAGLSRIRLLVFLGDISAYTFLVHSQILHFCEAGIHTGGSTAANSLVVIGAAFVFTQMAGYVAKLILEAKKNPPA